MPKRTIPELADFLAEATGLSDSNLRSISRRLREAGMLSQYGHGRGAAAATAKDAATLLMVASTEVPPLHAALTGQALWACKPFVTCETEEDVAELIKEARDLLVDGEPAKNPVLLAESLIERRVRVREINILLAVGAHVSFYGTWGSADVPYSLQQGSIGSLGYELPEEASAYRAFNEKLGGRAGLKRQHIIDGRILFDIHDWLGLSDAAETSAA